MQRTLTGTVCAKEYITPLKNLFSYIRPKKKKKKNSSTIFRKLEKHYFGPMRALFAKKNFPKRSSSVNFKFLRALNIIRKTTKS